MNEHKDKKRIRAIDDSPLMAMAAADAAEEALRRALEEKKQSKLPANSKKLPKGKTSFDESLAQRKKSRDQNKGSEYKREFEADYDDDYDRDLDGRDDSADDFDRNVDYEDRDSEKFDKDADYDSDYHLRADSDSDLDSDTKYDSDTSYDSDYDYEAKSDSDYDSEADSDYDAESDSDFDSKDDYEEDSDSDFDSDFESDMNSEDYSDSEKDTKHKSKYSKADTNFEHQKTSSSDAAESQEELHRKALKKSVSNKQGSKNLKKGSNYDTYSDKYQDVTKVHVSASTASKKNSKLSADYSESATDYSKSRSGSRAKSRSRQSEKGNSLDKKTRSRSRGGSSGYSYASTPKSSKASSTKGASASSSSQKSSVTDRRKTQNYQESYEYGPRASSSSEAQIRRLPTHYREREDLEEKKQKAKRNLAKILSLGIVLLAVSLAFLIYSIRSYRNSTVAGGGDSLNSDLDKVDVTDESRESESTKKAEIDSYPERSKFAGLNFSGLKREEAVAFIEKETDTLLSNVNLRLSYDGNQYEIKAADIDAKPRFKEILTMVESKFLSEDGKDKSAKKRKRKNSESEEDAELAGLFDSSYPDDKRVPVDFDEDKLMAKINQISSEIEKLNDTDKAMSFDVKTLQFVVNSDAKQLSLDQEKLQKQLKALLHSGEVDRELKLEMIETEVNNKVVSSEEFGLIAEATTPIMAYETGRNQNLIRAAELINGTVIPAGGVFSFLKCMGEFTIENGFRIGLMQADGFTISGIGGGICQASSTLFQAAAKAGLEFPVRHNHDVPSMYCNLGEDAMVCDWADLQVKNTKDTAIALVSWFDDSGPTFNCRIYGKKFPEGTEVKLSVKHEGYVQPGPDEIVRNTDIPPGTSKVLRKKVVGQITKLYRIYYMNGVAQKTEFVAKSVYRAFAARIAVNDTAQPSATNQDPNASSDVANDELTRSIAEILGQGTNSTNPNTPYNPPNSWDTGYQPLQPPPH